MAIKSKTTAILTAFLLTAWCVMSCRSPHDRATEKPHLIVITTLFPLYDFARNIGGDKAAVTLLLPPGVEPHSFEPKPGDIIKINEADMFIFTNAAMEPWVADVLKGIDNKNLAIIDSSKGITLLKESAGPGDEHAGADPHLWLDFKNAQEMVDTICAGFVAQDPANKNYYIEKALAYKKRLSALDDEFKNSLTRCKKQIIIQGGHFAFGYLAKRYQLQYKAAYGFSPDAEPGPRRLYELSEFMKKHRIEYIYYEEMLSPRVAETIARETGASLLKLNAAHNVTREELDTGVSFIAIMQQNLNNLKIGLQCQ